MDSEVLTRARAAIPFVAIQRRYRQLRKRFFTRPEPTTSAWIIDATPEEVAAAFGRHYYAPNWEFSYNYRGEDCNIARVEHVSGLDNRTLERFGDDLDVAPRDIDWWQLHVRGWAQPDVGTRVRVHREPEPTEHPRVHLAGTHVCSVGARDAIDDVFTSLDAAHTYHETLSPARASTLHSPWNGSPLR